jgi:hypothetical protein
VLRNFAGDLFSRLRQNDSRSWLACPDDPVLLASSAANWSLFSVILLAASLLAGGMKFAAALSTA